MERLGIVVAGTRAEQEYLAQRQKHPASADAVARWCGATPTAGWLCEDASAGMASAFGSLNFTETVAPGNGYRVATPYPNKRSIGFAVGTNAFTAPNATMGDLDGSSVRVLLHVRFGALDGTLRQIISKWTSSAEPGWLLSATSTALQLHVSDGTTLRTSTLSRNYSNSDVWIAAGVNATTAVSHLDTRYQSHAGTSLAGHGSGSNAQAMRVGKSSATSAPFDLLAWYLFDDAQAEIDFAAALRRIGRYIGA